jgi:hypothetical protein
MSFGQHVQSSARENYLGYFLWSIGGFPVVLWYAVHHSERFPLGPVSFVLGAMVSDVFPFWGLSGLCFLQNGFYVQVIQLFWSQSGWIPADCGYSCNSLYLLDIFA